MSSTSTSCVLKKRKNNPPYITGKRIRDFVKSALQEDHGSGDHTSLSTIPPGKKARARLIVKENGVLAGVQLATEIFFQVDPRLKVVLMAADGAPVRRGDIAFVVIGPARSILLAERLVLNVMQRMSGIATQTAHLMRLCKGTGAQVLDTRKTTPNFRFAEKWAVLLGGGANHRFGLYDRILVKDNHIDISGGIVPAIRKVKKYLRTKKLRIPVEVEARSLREVKQIVGEGGVQRILLDNMTTGEMRKAVKFIGRKAETEASGGIDEHSIRKVALTGVNFISVGALTHRVRSLDLSLKAF
ncbi:MAG: carboxylating nicotinate-nucleotide diphosphorylase [Bacteroidia bacterium]|nr:carboxylating nicotinate-nucleotide diphosphorylase [Bacteroidia bacterium]